MIVNRVAVASPSNQMIHPVTKAVMLLSLPTPMARHKDAALSMVMVDLSDSSELVRWSAFQGASTASAFICKSMK